MAYKGHPVIDADSHIREYWDLDRTYTAYMDPEYRATWEQFHTAVKGQQKRPGDVGFGELLWPRLPGHPMGVYDAFAAPPQPENAGFDRSVSNNGHKIDPSCHWDPNVRLGDMDTAGVDISVMFASQSDGFCMLDDVGFESALQRAYHRFMNQYCSEAEGRLRWVGNSNMRDIDESIAQLKYWTEHDPNFAGMFISRACPDGAMLDHPRLRPLFAASQELNMPIWVHGGSNRPPLTPWPGAPNALYHGWGGQFALAGLVGGGVFDLFPTLRIGLFESGIGWMPWLVEKLDDGYRPGSAQTPYQKRTASEIVASGQLFVSIEADEEYIGSAVEELGEHVWLFATDYPHNGTCWPEGVPLVDKQEISESAKIAMLGGNAQRFLPRLVN